MVGSLGIRVTYAVLNYRLNYPSAAIILALLSVAILVFVERRRKKARSYPPRDVLRIATQSREQSSNEVRWDAHTSDDPISDWSEDCIGRTAVVELIADHALRLRTPVVALLGGLGDGKSSVLNLLRVSTEGEAIVVSFNAWLPGSEATLAADLFKDIATECRKFVLVPQLRKRALAFARIVGGSASYLGGIKEFLPAQSQRDELEELRGTLSR